VATTPEDAVRLWLAGALAFGLVGAALAPVLGGLAASVALGAGPVGLHVGRARRDRRLVAELPDLVERVAAELRGGGTVASALADAARAPGPLASELRSVRARVELGRSLADSLSDWARGRRLPGLAEAAGACAVATSTGGRSAVALVGLAGALRERADAVAEARALSAQARLSAVVIGGAPLAYLLFTALVDPRSLAVLVGTPFGLACLAAGLTLDGIAAAWMRRILRIPA
jgi:tight adherence protein B